MNPDALNRMAKFGVSFVAKADTHRSECKGAVGVFEWQHVDCPHLPASYSSRYSSRYTHQVQNTALAPLLLKRASDTQRMPPTLAVMPGAMVSASSSKLGRTLSVRSWMDRSAPPARGAAGCVVHARARAPPVPMEPTEAISEVAGKPAVIATQRATLTPTHMSSTAAVLELLRVLVINTEIAQLNLELDHLSLGVRRMVGDSSDGGRVAVVPENKGMAHLHLPAVPPPPPSASWRAPGTLAGDNDDGDSGEFSSLDEDDETLVHCLATKVLTSTHFSATLHSQLTVCLLPPCADGASIPLLCSVLLYSAARRWASSAVAGMQVAAVWARMLPLAWCDCSCALLCGILNQRAPQ